MKRLLISGYFVLQFIAVKAQTTDKPKVFKLPDIEFKFDTLTQKYKAEKFPILVAPRLQAFLKNNINPTQGMPCFFPDITLVTPIPNYSSNMVGIIPIRIPNTQTLPYKNNNKAQ